MLVETYFEVTLLARTKHTLDINALVHPSHCGTPLHMIFYTTAA